MRKTLAGRKAMTVSGRLTHAPTCTCHVSRRTFLTGAAALGAAAILPGAAARAQGATIIDTHLHYYPPAYQQAWMEWEDTRKMPHWAGQTAWTREKTVAEMDKAGIRSAMLSLPSTWGVWFDGGPEAAARMVRICNDYGAQMVGDFPGRFGLFAPLSMLDTDTTLKEIEYVFDTLRRTASGCRPAMATNGWDIHRSSRSWKSSTGAAAWFTCTRRLRVAAAISASGRSRR